MMGATTILVLAIGKEKQLVVTMLSWCTSNAARLPNASSALRVRS